MGRPLKHNLAGIKIGRLSILEQIDIHGLEARQQFDKIPHDTIWRCLCECGKISYARGVNLLSGHTLSCGDCRIYVSEGQYMRCTLYNGHSFIFDAKDYAKVKPLKWVYMRGYFKAALHGKEVWLHRHILHVDGNKVVDHINGDRSDNRKQNLRIVTQRQNTWNAGISKSNTTGYKGVYFDSGRKRYSAKIGVSGTYHFLGRYQTVEEAAIAYNEAALRYFGEYARINVVGQPFMTISACELAAKVD